MNTARDTSALSSSAMGARAIAAAAIVGGLTVAAAVVACTGEDPDLAAPAEDGGAETSVSDQSAPVDAGVDAPKACARTDPFGKASLLAGVNDGSNLFHPRLTPDEKEIFYQHAKQGIYRATRPDRTLSFGAGSPIPVGDAAANVQDPSVSSDTLVVYASLDFRIARLSRSSRVTEFGAPAFVELGAEAGVRDVDPHVLSDQTALYFTRVMADAGTKTIWRARGDGDGGFAAPELVSLGPDTYTNASVSDDELELYVAHETTNAIHRAERSTAADPFPTPTPVDDINSQTELGGNPRPGWISPDRCRFYFVAGDSPSRIWVAERAPH